MGGNFIHQHAKDIAEDTIGSYLNFKRKIGLFTLSIAIFSTLSYLTTYSFLFGYYFGGGINNSFSNFEIFRRFVPFHFNTMTFTYFMISLSMLLIIYFLKFFMEKGLTFKFLAIICLVIYHLMMTAYFSQDITFKNVVLFGAIWIIPLLIGVMILFVIQGIKSPFKTYSGSVFGVSLIIIYIFFFQPNLSEEWILILTNFGLFSFGTLFSRVPYNKFWNFIFIFPYAFLALAFIISMTNLESLKGQTHLIKATIMIGIPFMVSVFLSFIFINRLKDKSIQANGTSESTSINKFILNIVIILFNPKTHKGALVFIIIMLLGAFVMTPRISTATAKIIRSFTPARPFLKNYIWI